MIATIALGQYLAAAYDRSRTILAFVLNRSSRVMPATHDDEIERIGTGLPGKIGHRHTIYGKVNVFQLDTPYIVQ